MDKERILPRNSISLVTRLERIVPSSNFSFRNLHSRDLPEGIVAGVEAEWCPVCHSDNVSEKVNCHGKPLWVCEVCDYEW